METVTAKQILTPVKGDFEHYFYVNYNMNLYRGCNHGCVYCDSLSLCYGYGQFDVVKQKQNALDLLRRELMQKRKIGIVGIGAASDTYNVYEKEALLTRGALELLAAQRFGVSFSTKSALVKRDVHLLSRMGRYAPVGVAFSITCATDDLCALIEPSASPTTERFGAMAALAQKGVFTGLWLNPVLPFITDDWENLNALLHMTREAGGRFAVCHFGMTLRTGNREYYFNALDKHFPGVKEHYLKAFGNAYECPSPHAEALYRDFKHTCGQLGLLYRFEDINRANTAHMPQQIALF